MDYTRLHFDNFVYLPPTKNGNRHIGTVMYLDDGSFTDIIISTPVLKAVRKVTFNENRYYLELELEKHHQEFYNFLTDLDDKNIKMVYDNSKTWFGKNIPLGVIDDFYKPFVRARRKPLIKVRIPHQNGIYSSEFPIKDVKCGTLLRLKLKYNGMKFLKQQFSNIWEVAELQLVDMDEDIYYEFDSDLEESDLFLKGELDKLVKNYEENHYDHFAGNIKDTMSKLISPHVYRILENEDEYDEMDEESVIDEVKIDDNADVVREMENESEAESEAESENGDMVEMNETVEVSEMDEVVMNGGSEVSKTAEELNERGEELNDTGDELQEELNETEEELQEKLPEELNETKKKLSEEKLPKERSETGEKLQEKLPEERNDTEEKLSERKQQEDSERQRRRRPKRISRGKLHAKGGSGGRHSPHGRKKVLILGHRRRKKI